MLEILVKIAEKLQPFRQLTYLLAALLVGIIITQLLTTPSSAQSSSSFAMLSFIGVIWLILFNILLSLFHNIPAHNEESKGVFSCVKIKIQRIFYNLFALLFIGLTLMIVFLSIKMIRI
jgi:uncharacterized membrane protein